MDKNVNDIVYSNPQMFTNIFKYGPEYINPKQGNRRNVLFTNPELEEFRKKILKDVNDLLDNRRLTDIIDTEGIGSTIRNIINNSVINNGDTIQNIIDNSVKNLDFLDVNMDSINSWSFDTNLDLYTFTKVAINSVENENYNLFVDGNIFSNSIRTTTINLDEIEFTKNINKLITKNDNNLYYKDEKITNLDPEEVYNNITSWSLDSNNNTYTFSNVGINTVSNNDFQLTIKGNTLISEAIFLKNPAYKIHVKNSHLYFNNCRLDKCDQDSITFYLCFDYNLQNA